MSRVALVRPAALVAGYALLLAAWTFANPPYASPDEWAHVIRAVGVAGGDAIGDPVPSPPDPGAGELEARREAWVSQARRAVVMPAGLYAFGLDCNAARADVSAACLDRLPPPASTDTLVATPVGNYHPLPYVLPGVAARLASSPAQADRLGRVAGAVSCLLLLAFAVLASWRAERPLASLAGPLAAVTPMVVFVCATVNPSGLETAAGLAFTAGVVRLARPSPERSGTSPAPAALWAATAAAGALLALSRSPGPLWVVLLVGLGVALRPRAFTSAGERWHALAAGGALAVALALSVAWEAAYGSRLPLRREALTDGIPDAVAALPNVLSQLVGAFGSLEVALPRGVHAAWYAALAALVVLAAVRSTARERAILGAAVAAVLALVVVLFAVMRTGATFDVQGRHVLPVAVAVPLLAGDLLARRGPRDAGLLVAVLAPFAGAVHLVAWWLNARRHAVGANGPLLFLDSTEWAPPLGWWTWLAAAAAGALLVASVAVPVRGRR